MTELSHAGHVGKVASFTSLATDESTGTVTETSFSKAPVVKEERDGPRVYVDASDKAGLGRTAFPLDMDKTAQRKLYFPGV